MTANYRRWMHTFPRSADGSAFQAHHTPISEQEHGASLSKLGASLSERGASLSANKLPGAADSSHKSLPLASRGGSGVSLSSSSSSSFHKAGSDPGQRRQQQQLLFTVKSWRKFEVRPKVCEDFANIRRTGMDWKSLTEPACLPVTIDFFPSEDVLSRDYFEYPSKIVVSNIDTTQEQK